MSTNFTEKTIALAGDLFTDDPPAPTEEQWNARVFTRHDTAINDREKVFVKILGLPTLTITGGNTLNVEGVDVTVWGPRWTGAATWPFVDAGGAGIHVAQVTEAGELVVVAAADESALRATLGTVAWDGISALTDATVTAVVGIQRQKGSYSTGVTSEEMDAAIAAAISALIAGAPGALDTLNELAAALADDAAFSTTVTNALNARLVAANNLSDLANVATALVNLGLTSIVDGSSGADLIGATAIAGLTGATVQALLESLKAAVDAISGGGPHSTEQHTDLAKNDATSNFAAHIFGYQAGTIRSGNAAYGITAATVDLNSGNGMYVLYWEPLGGLQLAYDASSADAPAGSIPLHSFVVTAGEITTHNDLRTWLNMDVPGGGSGTISVIENGGTPVASVDTIEFVDGTNTTVTVTDNEDGSVSVAVNAPGGGSMPPQIVPIIAGRGVRYGTAYLQEDTGSNGTILGHLFANGEEFLFDFIVPADFSAAGNVTLYVYSYAFTSAASKYVEYTVSFSPITSGESWDAAYSTSMLTGDIAVGASQDVIARGTCADTGTNLSIAALDFVRAKLTRTTPTGTELSGDDVVIAAWLELARA
jgi:hypothetical protein